MWIDIKLANSMINTIHAVHDGYHVLIPAYAHIDKYTDLETSLCNKGNYSYHSLIQLLHVSH